MFLRLLPLAVSHSFKVESRDTLTIRSFERDHAKSANKRLYYPGIPWQELKLLEIFHLTQRDVKYKNFISITIHSHNTYFVMQGLVLIQSIFYFCAILSNASCNSNSCPYLIQSYMPFIEYLLNWVHSTKQLHIGRLPTSMNSAMQGMSWE